SCAVSSNVKWINLDVDYNFYASGSAYARSYTTTWNSASVANGSHTIQCNGYGSNGALLGNPTAHITVSNGATPTPTPTPTPPPPPPPPATVGPSPTPTPNPVGCTTIPGTSTPVGAGCLPTASYPVLANPQDPVNYGADPTGASDSTAAIKSAMA